MSDGYNVLFIGGVADGRVMVLPEAQLRRLRFDIPIDRPYPHNGREEYIIHRQIPLNGDYRRAIYYASLSTMTFDEVVAKLFTNYRPLYTP